MPKGLHRPKPDCHPDRPHYGNGLCESCYRRQKYANDPEYRTRILTRLREYRLRNLKQCREYNRSSYKRNKRKHIDQIIQKRKTDPTLRLLTNLRSRINQALHRCSKSGKTNELVGCSIEDLWIYLESKFEPGMTRQNYGKWHLDHIIPCSIFDLSKPEHQKRCFHFSNLQPLWAEDNLTKRAQVRSNQFNLL